MEQTTAPAAGMVVFHGDEPGEVIDVAESDTIDLSDWR